MDIAEWVKLMRTCKAQTVTVLVSNAWIELVPYSRDRVALLLPTGSSASLDYSWGSTSPTGNGVHAGGLNAPWALNILEHGAMVLGPVYAFCGSGGPIVIAYTEVLAYLP